MSAIFHGMLLLLCAAAIPHVLNLIPLASLAAILFLVGYKLAKPVLFKQMYNLGWSHFIPFVVTIVGIVLTDLLVGIGLGLTVAIFYVLYNNYKRPYLFKESEFKAGEPIRLELAEDVTFLHKANILRTLSQIPDDSNVIIDASRSINIDQDVIEIIEDFEINAHYRSIAVKVISRRNPALPNQVKQFEVAVLNESNPEKEESLLASV